MSPNDDDRCIATNREGERCGAWAMSDSDKCYHHRGTSSDGSSHAGNGNAVTHAAHRRPEFLKSDIVGTEHEDTFHAVHEALCDRHERFHGWIDAGIEKDLEEAAVMYVKRDLIDIHAREHAAEDSPLVEEHIIGTDDDGRPIEVADVNKLQDLWTHLRRETRLLLKDMGLYSDPESQKADAISELNVEIRREPVE